MCPYHRTISPRWNEVNPVVDFGEAPTVPASHIAKIHYGVNPAVEQSSQRGESKKKTEPGWARKTSVRCDRLRRRDRRLERIACAVDAASDSPDRAIAHGGRIRVRELQHVA